MLPLTHIKLGLRDLLDKRRPHLLQSKAGAYYEPMLDEQLAEMEKLPAALTGTPLVELLDSLDTDHDGYGAAIYFTTETYLRMPGVDAETKDAARRIRESFIPALGELGASYAVQADRAIERKPLLASMKGDLQRFPLAGGKTLLDAATAFLEAGERIHRALSDRADVPKGARREAAKIRSVTIGLLGRLRADVSREVNKDPALPRDLEAQIFGYFDTLEAMVASGQKEAPQTAEA